MADPILAGIVKDATEAYNRQRAELYSETPLTKLNGKATMQDGRNVSFGLDLNAQGQWQHLTVETDIRGIEQCIASSSVPRAMFDYTWLQAQNQGDITPMIVNFTIHPAAGSTHPQYAITFSRTGNQFTPSVSIIGSAPIEEAPRIRQDAAQQLQDYLNFFEIQYDSTGAVLRVKEVAVQGLRNKLSEAARELVSKGHQVDISFEGGINGITRTATVRYNAPGMNAHCTLTYGLQEGEKFPLKTETVLTIEQIVEKQFEVDLPGAQWTYTYPTIQPAKGVIRIIPGDESGAQKEAPKPAKKVK